MHRTDISQGGKQMADVQESINWRADEWFTKYHHAALTEQFKGFWVCYYGDTTSYGNDEDEQHEYWVRCAFCLTGWNAGRRYEHYIQTQHHTSLWKDFVDDFRYNKEFYDTLLPSGEIVEQCWPNAGFMTAGDGRRWSGKDGVKVRLSLKHPMDDCEGKQPGPSDLQTTSMWQNANKVTPGMVHYSVMRMNGDIEGMSAIRAMFPDAQADEMNFVLFSTGGISGTYDTIEEAGASLKCDTPKDVSFLIVHPRRVALRYGSCVPKTQDDIDYLDRLRASSHEAMSKIGGG